MKQLSKREAAAALGISLRTLHNRMKNGQVKFTKVSGAVVGEQSVFFTYEGLGLDEPAHDVPKPATSQKQEPALNLREGLQPNEVSPEAYRDSFGHRLEGNERHRLIERQYAVREQSQAHMEPYLLGTSGRHKPFFDDAHFERWHPGHIERKERMRRDAGLRPQNEQEQKQVLDVRAIALAFHQGFSR